MISIRAKRKVLSKRGREVGFKDIDAKSWEYFEQKLKKLRAENGTESSPLLFRGQGNSAWQLGTTLERYTKNKGMTCLGYYNLITGSIGPELKSFSRVAVPERRQDVADSFLDKGLMFNWPRCSPIHLSMIIWHTYGNLVSPHLCSIGRARPMWRPSSPFVRTYSSQ